MSTAKSVSEVSVQVKGSKTKAWLSRYKDSLRYALHVITHPFDGFWDLVHEKRGTIAAANTFLLPTKTFIQGNPSVNKLALVRDYVAEGGSFCMIGGYLTFMGFEGKGRYKRTPIEEIMPVEFYESDDRAEHPEGFSPTIVAPDHPVFEGIDEKIPDMLGYNRTILKADSTLLAEHDGDPIIATATYGKGRTMAYTCDCAPHWAPLTLCNWKYYGKLWQNIAHWLANK